MQQLHPVWQETPEAKFSKEGIAVISAKNRFLCLFPSVPTKTHSKFLSISGYILYLLSGFVKGEI